MSTAIDMKSVSGSLKRMPWALWRRQITAILRLEVKKNFLGKRAILIYLLALGPVFLMAALMLDLSQRDFQELNNRHREFRSNVGALNMIFANIYEGLILRTVVFFGCAWIFMNLFRGEVVDRSLHYYFLSALRREVLVVGKYVSGVVTSGILFLLTTILSLFFVYLAIGYPENVNHLTSGSGLREVGTYALVTILGCLGYGAVFLVVGLFFRNPMIPALIIYGWEWINFLLPPFLKRISVIHYLHSLAPVPVPEGPFAMVAEPTPAWISIPGLLILTAFILVFASIQIRRQQISYGGE